MYFTEVAGTRSYHNHMKPSLLLVALFMGQMRTLQDKPMVRLRPHQDAILAEFGGETILLANGPPVMHLPSIPPRLDSQRKPWAVTIDNLGPGTVTIEGKAQFTAHVRAYQSIQIRSDGVIYLVVP